MLYVEFAWAKLFLHQYVLFQLAWLFIWGNSWYRFPKRWDWQICHIHPPFKLPLHTFSGKLQTFPTVKSKTIGFLLKNYAWVTSENIAASAHYARVPGTCYPTWCTLLHYKRFENCWKHFPEQFLMLQMCVLHHALVEWGKDKTIRNSTSLKPSISTVITKLLNQIARSHIVYIDTTGFLFVVQ